MGKIAPAFWVGLVVIGAFFAFVFTFGSVEKAAVTAKDSYVIRAVFDDVTGLAERSRITVSGIPVGEIDRIALDPETGRRALVTLRIRNGVVLHRGEPDATGRLVSGAVVTRRQASLLGDYYLELAPGVAGPPLQPGDEIAHVVSVSGLAAVLDEIENSGELVARFERIAANIEAVTASLATVLGGEQGTRTLSEVAENLRQASDDIRALTGDARGFMRESVAGRAENIHRIIENIERFTGQAASISGKVDASIERSLQNIEVLTAEVRGLVGRSSGKVEASLGVIHETLGRVQGSVATLDEALRHVRDTTRKVNEGEGTIGRLVNDPRLADSVEETVADAGDIVKSISRLQTKVELRVEYGMLGGAFKTYLGLRLQPKADKYYQIEIIDDPRGRTRFMKRVTETNDPALPALLRETVAETSDELKFSLYFAKRFRFLVGRFGIIESSGGLGLDLVFWDERFRASFDIFEFGLDHAPRFKGMMSLRVFDHFLLLAGVDDVFDSRHREYFLGLGLAFSDDDLKALFTVAPTPSF